MDEEVQPSSGYYLQPVDNAGVREFKRYVKSPVPPQVTHKNPHSLKTWREVNTGVFSMIFLILVHVANYTVLISREIIISF